MLKDYDILVFRDDKMAGLDFSMLNEIVEAMRRLDRYAAFPVHPRNVIGELMESMQQPRYRMLRHRMAKYVAEELEHAKAEVQVHFGCNVSVRDIHHPDTRPAGDLWMKHIARCGIQDQISFHFVAQHYPKILPIPQEFGFRRSLAPVPQWV